MASREELLISKSNTFRSRRALAASSFIVSSALCTAFVGLAEPGDCGAENVGIGGDGAEDILSASEAMLSTRFSVFSGLGESPTGSPDGTFLGSVTESMDERLALLPWVPRMA
jgi:hypothetical protein